MAKHDYLSVVAGSSLNQSVPSNEDSEAPTPTYDYLSAVASNSPSADKQSTPAPGSAIEPTSLDSPTPKPKFELDGGVMALARNAVGIRDAKEGGTIKIGQGMMQLKNGVIQASMDALESMGIVDKGTADEFTKLSNEERVLVDRNFKNDYGDSFGFDIAEVAGEVLPTFLIPALGAKTAKARIAGGAGAGAATGATAFQPEEDSVARQAARGASAAVGLATGAGLSSALETVTALRNWIPKAIEKAKKLHQPAIKEGVDLQARTGVMFKLSQLAQDPALERAERFARTGDAAERVGRAIEDAQPKQVLEHFEKIVAPKQAGPQLPMGVRVQRGHDRIIGDASKGTGLLGARKTAAAKNFRKAEEAGGLITTGNFLQEAKKLIQQNSGPGAGKTELALASELQRIMDDVIDQTGGALTPMQLQRRLEAWGRASKGTGKILSDQVDRAAEKGPAKALFSALNRDLDAAISAGGRGSTELKVARDTYRADTAKITAVRESALGKLFDVKGTPTRVDIESKLLKMDPDELRSTMQILSKTDRHVQQHLQTFWLSRAIEKAKVPGEAGAVEFIPAKLLDLHTGAKGPAGATSNREVFDAVFTDPTVRKQVKDGLKAVSVMMANNFRTSGRTVSRLKNLANVTAEAGRSAKGLRGELLDAGRLWAMDVLAPEHVARYVLDPQGVRALTTLAEPFNDNAASAALTTLLNIALRDAPPDES